MTTAARPQTHNDSHWYSPAGEPCYEIIGKTTGKPRPVTIRDAREHGWLPSVTTILKVLAKPALQDWLVEQAVLAALTSPRNDGEPIDAFVHRILHAERVQDQESKIARERGTEIHDAMEAWFQGKQVSPEILPWIKPAAEHLACLGQCSATEFIVIGDGYAGRVDLELTGSHRWLIDFKTTKKLPEKGAWPEARIQLGAYQAARETSVPRLIRTANVYISTVEQGQFAFFENPEPEKDFTEGFLPALRLWQYINSYQP